MVEGETESPARALRLELPSCSGITQTKWRGRPAPAGSSVENRRRAHPANEHSLDQGHQRHHQPSPPRARNRAAAQAARPFPTLVRPTRALPVPTSLQVGQQVGLQRRNDPQVPSRSRRPSRVTRQRRHPPSAHTPPFQAAAPDRTGSQQAAHPHRRPTRRTPQPQHHPGLRGHLPTRRLDHYDQFLERRRATRPGDEYRQPTADELQAFADHFGRRRVELGDCVRPYGSGCTYEHACIRCRFLNVHPDAGGRLNAIEQDLHQRITTAEQDHWLADVEQLRVTLKRVVEEKAPSRRSATRTSPGSPSSSMRPWRFPPRMSRLATATRCR